MKRNIGPKTLKQTLFLETHLQPIRGRVQGDKSPFPMMSSTIEWPRLVHMYICGACG